MDKADSGESIQLGISSLPKGWAVVVQLVGTFGLAVFLVLYYVLVMHPKEVDRYEKLNKEVKSLGQIIMGNVSQLTSEKVANLEELYVFAVSYDIAEIVENELRSNSDENELSKKIEDKLIYETQKLEGLIQKDEGIVSERLTH